MLNDQAPHNNQTASLIYGIQESLAKTLPWILLVAGGMSVVFFALWLRVVFFWPAQDAERQRLELLLPNNKVLVVDYPQRFLADDEPRPVYLTTDVTQPTTITIKLPTTLPLVLTAVEPISATRLVDTTNGYITVTWPLTISAGVVPGASSIAAATMPTSQLAVPVTGALQSPVSTTVPAPEGMIPFLGHTSTVILSLKNASSVRGSPITPCSGFKETSFAVIEAGDKGVIAIGVETTDRANLRLFADKYSFIAVLPFLITALGALRKLYVDRQNQLKEKARQSLGKFREALALAELSRLDQVSRDFHLYHAYHPKDDLERATVLEKLACAERIHRDITANDFSTWPDSWAGALSLAADRILSHKTAKRPASDTEAPQPIDHPENGAKDQGSKSPSNTEAPQLIDLQTLYRYVRVFPRDLLSVGSERPFQELRTRLQLGPIQRHKWPREADSPKGYSRDISPDTIQKIGLFPADDAALDTERRYLFSSVTEWFWREHPLYGLLSRTTKPTIVYGDPGTGKTALALSLTQFADSDSKQVLATYHARPAQLADIQLGVGQALLKFVQWRSTWLMKLERDERDLLARLLLTVLSSHFLLAELGAIEPMQFETAENSNQKALWQEQASLELRLLRQAVERMASQPPLPANHWFLGLCHCAAQLEFQLVRIALDMSSTDWAKWRSLHLDGLLNVVLADYDLPVQLLLAVSRCEDEISHLPESITAVELNWHGPDTQSPLLEMVIRHRALQRGIREELLPVSLPALSELGAAAQFNPRRLARLWKFIQEAHGDAEALTSEFVAAAKDKVL